MEEGAHKSEAIPRKEKAMPGKSEYRNGWIAEKLDRINLTVPKGRKDIIKAHAEARSESVNAFINRAISEAMERDNAAREPQEGAEKPQTVNGSGQG